MKPVRLEPRFVERVWGTTDLSPWFPDRPENTGEVWLTSDENQTSEGLSLRALMDREGDQLLGTAVTRAYGGRFPILVKFLFTNEKLSVQVHPDDAYSEEHEGSPGKTEMWYVLRSRPGATIAAGFRETLQPAQLRRAVYEGTVAEALEWWPAAPGQTYFIPAKTVHAVGAGIVICEIQQNSDVTYRLWDYGRPRELHVENSMAVADLGPHPGPLAPKPFGGGELLASCPQFAAERLDLNEPVQWTSDSERFHLLVATRGSGLMKAGGTTVHIRMGECWLIPAACGSYAIDGADLEILRIYVPA
ncbi:MAG TPA: type I phosphomannose isomerase catalytic subunit [Bryobacteraceae bacterium]|nr:type I phosphomannose isomerase catalytic subunit [Bryobacteraceae bacterium]